jgi:hypothetical protein
MVSAIETSHLDRHCKRLTKMTKSILDDVHGAAVITTTCWDYQQDYAMRMETQAGKIGDVSIALTFLLGLSR